MCILGDILRCCSLPFSYNGKRCAVCIQARQLLKEASEGLNPFEGFTPKLADGESLVFGTQEFDEMEAKGLEAAAKTGFVLVSCCLCCWC